MRKCGGSGRSSGDGEGRGVSCGAKKAATGTGGKGHIACYEMLESC